MRKKKKYIADDGKNATDSFFWCCRCSLIIRFVYFADGQSILMSLSVSTGCFNPVNGPNFHFFRNYLHISLGHGPPIRFDSPRDTSNWLSGIDFYFQENRINFYAFWKYSNFIFKLNRLCRHSHSQRTLMSIFDWKRKTAINVYSLLLKFCKWHTRARAGDSQIEIVRQKKRLVQFGAQCSYQRHQNVDRSADRMAEPFPHGMRTTKQDKC